MGREDLIEKQFERPGSEAHAEVERIFLERTRDEWHEFASQHDCCLEPVLGLDEALDSELVRAREMVVRARPAGHRRREPAGRAGQAVAHPGRARRARARRWASTPARCSRRLGYSDEEVAALIESGAAAGASSDAQGSFLA